MNPVYPSWLDPHPWVQRTTNATEETVRAALACARPGIRELAALLSPAAADSLETMAQRARNVTRRRFGKTVSLYVPLYLSSHCPGGCAYCGYAADRKRPRRRLGETEMLEEMGALRAMGFEDVLLLTGERSPQADFGYLRDAVALAAKSFHTICVESFAMTEDEYRDLERAGCTSITLYQETYDPSRYEVLHRWGEKRNYGFRLEAPARALAAGMRTAGLGVLLGLSDPLTDCLCLYRHIEHLRKRFWQTGIAVSFPRVRPEAGHYRPEFEIDSRFLARIIFAFRICLPDTPLVLSTRESPAFRDGMAGVGINRMSAASRTTVGGYTGARTEDSGQFEVSDTRSVETFCCALRKKGLEPVFKNWDAVFHEAPLPAFAPGAPLRARPARSGVRRERTRGSGTQGDCIVNGKAVALMSGGLDSTVAVRLMLDMGIDMTGVHFTGPFCQCNRGAGGCIRYAQAAAEKMGIAFRTIPLKEDYLDIVIRPRHGYGSGANPCVDCRILMLRKAGEIMAQTQASFVVTGEVLGQRPMSQLRDKLTMIERESGLEGLVVRPLCGKHLPPSIPEQKGVVPREKLLAIAGRGRREQMDLAAFLEVGDYPCPAGGCLLTDRHFAARVKDAVAHEELTLAGIALLKIGRHFRLSPATRVILGRNEEENKRLLALSRDGDKLVELTDQPGPLALVKGANGTGSLRQAGAIAASYSKSRREDSVPITVMDADGEKQDEMTVAPAAEAARRQLRIGRDSKRSRKHRPGDGSAGKQ